MYILNLTFHFFYSSVLKFIVLLQLRVRYLKFQKILVFVFEMVRDVHIFPQGFFKHLLAVFGHFDFLDEIGLFQRPFLLIIKHLLHVIFHIQNRVFLLFDCNVSDLQILNQQQVLMPKIGTLPLFRSLTFKQALQLLVLPLQQVHLPSQLLVLLRQFWTTSCLFSLQHLHSILKFFNQRFHLFLLVK